jgi:hypothetical protein
MRFNRSCHLNLYLPTADMLQLLELLEERVSNWSHRQLIGDVFLRFTQEFKVRCRAAVCM